ncbi:MAG: cation:proton antiporter [Acidimicrobiia bacterium]|nr:cation:proton antiporter [Acidimicrobiia bacterium]
MHYADLAGVAIVAVLAPILVNLAPQLRLPSVALEILLGIIVGPSVLGWIEADVPVEVLSTIGLGYLLFLAGMELDFDAVRTKLRPIASGFGISIVLAAAVALLIGVADANDEPLFVAIVLLSTSLSLVVPVLTEAALNRSEFGQLIMGSSSVAEFGSLLLLSIFFSVGSSGPGAQILLLGAFVVLAIVGGLALTRVGRSIRALDLLERLGDTPAQLGVRFLLVVMLVFLGFSTRLGFEAILGAFVAGALLRVTDSSGQLDDPKLKSKVEAIGYGFLIPAFFVTSGLNFDADALFGSPAHLLLVPVLIVGILVVRGVPAIVYRRLYAGRQLVAAGLLQSTTLSMMVVAASIGTSVGAIDAGTSAALLTAGIITVLVFPPIALALLGDEGALTPGWESTEDVDL